MLNQLFTISFTALYSQSKDTLLNTISQINNKLLDTNESNLIHLLFGDPSRDRKTNTEILNATINYVLTTKRYDERLFYECHVLTKC